MDSNLEDGRLPVGTGLPMNGAGQAVSAVPVGIPDAMIKQLRRKAKDFEIAAQEKRKQARELEIRAGEMYDAFISFDLLADKMEQQLAQAIEARRAETSGSVVDESAIGTADAPPHS